jgi:hypothetical protein
VKCELWEAANSTEPLPYYEDIPALTVREFPQDPERNFNLKNLFTEVEYIADYKLTLQVTDTGAVNPSANFIKNYAAPMTNLALAVGGQISDQGDRFIDLYQSVDFARLVASPENPLFARDVTVPGFPPFKFPKPPSRLARPPYASAEDTSPCSHGQALAGNLGLKEALASYAISARMQDIAVLLNPNPTSPSGGTLYGQPSPLSSFNGYAFGQMDTQVDFTLTLDVNGGPNWTLITFKGPNVTGAGGSNGNGLVNVSRLVKDTLIITVMPVCIRPKYFPKEWEHVTADKLVPGTAPVPQYAAKIVGTVKEGNISAEVQAKQQVAPQLPLHYPVEYTPPMFYGTPIWANYLPPCLSAAGQAALGAAQAAARTNNQLEGINNLLQGLPRM